MVDGLTPNQRANVRRLSEALRPLRDQLYLAHMTSLLAIAAEPGLSVNELADRVGIPQPSASRFVSILLGRYQSPDTAPPIPLIVQAVSSDDPRRRALFLSQHGEEIVRGILASMEKAGERD